MEEVVIDTNFAMIPFQFKVDVFEEIKKLGSFRIIMLKPCFKELEKIDPKVAAFVKRKKVEIVDFDRGSADEAILRYAFVNNAIIATQDRRLRKEATRRGIRVMYLRAKKKVILL